MQPRWYQRDAVNALLEYFRTHPAVVDGQVRSRNPLVCMPTGTGKSAVIGWFAEYALKSFPGTRVLMMTHVKELIAQNAAALKRIWPGAPLGIYSAGLKKKEINDITYAGVASIKNALAKLGKIDIVLIDEAHLLSPKDDGTYREIIEFLRSLNPYLVVIGFTATPYRLGIGSLTNNGIFTDTAIDLTTLEMFNRLVNEGFLAPLVTKRRGNISVDLSNVGVNNGEYKANELQAAADQTALTNNIVLDILNNGYGAGRRAGLVFSSGIEHAKHLSECFAYYGIEVPAVHSNMENGERDRILSDFKLGHYWGVIGNNIFTTGFDHPPVDFIACVRPTTSPGLWVQMLGRGTRPSDETGKTNCLVHDYAGNTERLGPINDPQIPKMKGKGKGEAPVWCCEMCGTYNHARAPYCDSCGFQHDMTSKLNENVSLHDVMISENPIVEMYEVNQVVYFKHVKRSDPTALPTMRVVYQCGLQSFFEYIALEHSGIAGHRARDWWRQRYNSDPPTTIDQALLYVDYLKKPQRISVHTNLKFPRVVGWEF